MAALQAILQVNLTFARSKWDGLDQTAHKRQYQSSPSTKMDYTTMHRHPTRWNCPPSLRIHQGIQE